MATHRKQPPLLVRPRFSIRLALFVVLTHVLAGAALIAVPRSPWQLLAVPVAASLGYQWWVHVLRRAPWSIESLVWDAQGVWHIELVSGARSEARLSPSTFVSVPLVVLNLSRSWRRWSLPLFADALDPEQHRHLRQRLRIEGATGSTDEAPA